MKPKTWEEHRAEMEQADRKEWLKVVAISLGVIAAGVMLAYLHCMIKIATE